MTKYTFTISMFFKQIKIKNDKKQVNDVSRVIQLDYPNIYNTFLKPAIRDYITYISDCRKLANDCIQNTKVEFIDDNIEVTVTCDRELSFTELSLMRSSLENIQTMDFINNPLFISKKTRDKTQSVCSDRYDSYEIHPTSVVVMLIN